MTSTLLPLGTKGSVPPTPTPFVRRRRLEELLSDGSRRRVTLVSASPGSGKTTLIAGWYRDHPGDRAWLTVDARDNDSERLVSSVLGTLIRAGVVPDAVGQVRDADTSALDAAFARLDPRRRCVLVLDDVHELTDADAVAVLRHLAEQAPDNLHVVLATRADPPFGLIRLRLDGRLGQIRSADLAFTRPEAALLLTAEGLSLGEDSLTALWDRTEGWAAGLRLAAGSLARGAEPQHLLAGVGDGSAEMTDHLLHEVLLRQEAEVQELLLRTSVVDRLTPELASVLSEDPDAGKRIAELEHQGVFLLRIEGADWFRYHPLLARRLRARLRARDPQLARRLQQRAAEWHAQCGMAYEAEQLAREGHDWPLLGHLLGRRWLAAVLAGEDLPRHLVGDVPPAALADVPMLTLLAASDACAAHDAVAAERYRAVIPRSGSSVDVATGEPQAVVAAVLDLLLGRTFGATERTGRAAEELASSPAVDLDVEGGADVGGGGRDQEPARSCVDDPP